MTNEVKPATPANTIPEVKFVTLSCGCEYSPVAGLSGMNCGEGEDAHQEFIKELAKPKK